MSDKLRGLDGGHTRTARRQGSYIYVERAGKRPAQYVRLRRVAKASWTLEEPTDCDAGTLRWVAITPRASLDELLRRWSDSSLCWSDLRILVDEMYPDEPIAKTVRRRGTAAVEPGTLVIATGDGDLVYRSKSGGYLVGDARIVISVRTQAVEREQLPSDVCFCLEARSPRKALASGMVFRGRGGLSRDEESLSSGARAYFGFHADSVSITWTVRRVRGERILFELSATHDDVNYYDGRARRTRTRGLFELGPKTKRGLWMPV